MAKIRGSRWMVVALVPAGCASVLSFSLPVVLFCLPLVVTISPSQCPSFIPALALSLRFVRLLDLFQRMSEDLADSLASLLQPLPPLKRSLNFAMSTQLVFDHRPRSLAVTALKCCLRSSTVTQPVLPSPPSPLAAPHPSSSSPCARFDALARPPQRPKDRASPPELLLTPCDHLRRARYGYEAEAGPDAQPQGEHQDRDRILRVLGQFVRPLSSDTVAQALHTAARGCCLLWEET